MPNDLDRAWIINGNDLRIGLSAHDDRPPLVPNPRDVAAYLLDFAGKPLDETRWPMTRGELATRLSKALELMFIAVSTDGMWTAPADGYATAKVSDPAYTAGQIVREIDAQGTDQRPAPEPCTCPVPTEKCLCGCTGEPVPDAEPDDGVPPDVTAAASIIRTLEALAGTSGAGWDHMFNTLRFVSGHFGYQLAEQDE